MGKLRVDRFLTEVAETMSRIIIVFPEYNYDGTNNT